MTQQIVTDPTARHVLLVLAGYAGQDGRGAHPTAARMARDTGLHERTVRAKLMVLEAEDLIRRDRELAAYLERRGVPKAICYDLVLDAPVQPGAPAAIVAGVTQSMDLAA
ncbi:helix-turn-helix domain-containing protein [Pigmentiphaga litoralis]|uniref:helix-turn-helix domain-containing protein n=1 Tax=Pigmentiphaga litoralis TaxID=516702 RepID=UPI001E5A95E9|nr:helix-turn-helix domain-containing protein [Pigmentiphaga litoralis]